jgi:hypothetical protein
VRYQQFLIVAGRFNGMIRNTLSSFVILLFCARAFSQAEREGFPLEISISPGISFQSFTDVFFIHRDYPPVSTSVGLSGEMNANGFGLPIVFNAYADDIKTGARYEPVLRYDVVRPAYPFSSGGAPKRDEYGFFADHHFSLYRKFWCFGSNQNIAGLGYSLISQGLSYRRDWYMQYNNTGRIVSGTFVDLSFGGIHALVGKKVAHRLWAEGKLLYVPKHRIIYNYALASMMFFLAATYQIPVGKFRSASL